jgi:endonuclease/exonuclease/phosphatase (EEP) superfamily protein YafD
MVARKRSRLLNQGFGLSVLIAIACSLTGYLSRLHPYLELTSHFKVQYLVIGCITLVFFSLSRKRSGIILSLCCILLNAAVILPWYFPASVPASPTSSSGTASPAKTHLRVLLANVNVKNQTYVPAIELIQREQPDLFAIIETNQTWLRELETLKASYPYQLRSPHAESFGIALYSKFPLRPEILSAPPEAEDFHLIATVAAQQPIAIIALHPPPPKNQRLSGQRNRELAAISRYIQTQKTPVIVIGDFNMTLWSPYYQQFTKDARLKDCRQGFGILPTWTTRFPPLYIPIDHCLVSPNITVMNIKTGNNVASDHLPVIAELSLPPNDRF